MPQIYINIRSHASLLNTKPNYKSQIDIFVVKYWIEREKEISFKI